jgi:hypothetical protein|tara:strand:+ start:602 stop:1045 length:444 start_codon:yes stop_codon:yes gene_type:complete
MSGTLIFTTLLAERRHLVEHLGAVESRDAKDAHALLLQGKTVVVTTGMCTGWRAPKGTQILFTASFPTNGPVRQQAQMRVSSALLDINPFALDPKWLGRCCVCGRTVDTREPEQGGDGHGSELTSGQWVCSSECWGKKSGPVPGEVE